MSFVRSTRELARCPKTVLFPAGALRVRLCPYEPRELDALEGARFERLVLRRFLVRLSSYFVQSNVRPQLGYMNLLRLKYLTVFGCTPASYTENK